MELAKLKPRKPLHGIEICEHGGKVGKDEVDKDEVKGVIDFSVNLNPYGPPDFVFTAIKEAMTEIKMYPDTESQGVGRRYQKDLDARRRKC